MAAKKGVTRRHEGDPGRSSDIDVDERVGLNRVAVAAVVVTCALILGLLSLDSTEAQAQTTNGAAIIATADERVWLDPGASWRQQCDGIAVRWHMGKFLYEWSEPATGRKYKGGTSWVRRYRQGECHTITRNGQVLHGPHPRILGDPQ